MAWRYVETDLRGREHCDGGFEAFALAQRHRVAERGPCPWCQVRSDIGCKHANPALERRVG